MPKAEVPPVKTVNAPGSCAACYHPKGQNHPALAKKLFFYFTGLVQTRVAVKNTG
jgi:hypothetical protein